MRYEILHTEYYDDKGNTVLWSLFFDGEEFVLDKEDLLEIADIVKTVLKNMNEAEGVDLPLLNRERVIHGA